MLVSIIYCLVSVTSASYQCPGVIKKMFGGGLTGLEALADPNASIAFRSNKGGLYIHNNGYDNVVTSHGQATADEIFHVFSGMPTIIELAYGPAWAKLYNGTYKPYNANVQYATINYAGPTDDAVPSLADWTKFQTAMWTKGGLPSSAKVMLFISPANSALFMHDKVAQVLVSKRPDYQAIIRASGGFAIDSPAQYFLNREQQYKDWIFDAIQWTKSNGFEVIWLSSPQFGGEFSFLENTKAVLNIMARNGCSSVPDVVAFENYYSGGDPNYWNPVGYEATPRTIMNAAYHVQLALAPDAPDTRCVFDANKYSAYYSDLQKAFNGDATLLKQHYIQFGMTEGRTPCGDLAPSCAWYPKLYQSQFPDLQNQTDDFLTQHYRTTGMNENRAVCP